jgi:hypothetical protein
VRTKDQTDLKKFDALARRLAPLERQARITRAECLASERLMYRMAAVRDGANAAVRKVLAKKYGWKS